MYGPPPALQGQKSREGGGARLRVPVSFARFRPGAPQPHGPDPTTREIYDFVCSFIAEQGYSPSSREIGGSVRAGLRRDGPQAVAQLVAKGWLRKGVEPLRVARAGRQRPPAARRSHCRCSAVVAAGAPIEPIEIGGAHRGAARAGAGPETASSCACGGESMIDEQIATATTSWFEAPARARRRYGGRRAARRRGDAEEVAAPGATGAAPAGERLRMKPIEVAARDVECVAWCADWLRRYWSVWHRGLRR